MTIKLPEFKGYTVDVKLKQFRKVSKEKGIKFIDFDSSEGDKLLAGYIDTLDLNNPRDKETLNAIWR